MYLTKEDLNAIAGIIDTRLEPIREDIRELKQDVTMLKRDVAELKQDVDILKQDMIVVKQDISHMKQDIDNMKQDIDNMKQDIDNMKQDITNLDHKTHSLHSNLTQVKLNQEVTVMPRLGTIESYYLDTYRRYVGGIAQLDQLQQDVDILKSTVAIHSRKLEIIA